MEGLIGRKLGMTQLFDEDGTVTPVTVIAAGPCVVTQLRTSARDGYDAAQLGLVDAKAAKLANKPMRGHHEQAGVPPTRLRREFPVVAGGGEARELKAGDPVTVEIFAGVSHVDVIGVSKGKGFQGVIRRHGFAGGRATHGSMFHRAPGSIGQSAWPSRVLKGMRAAGRMGGDRVTLKNVKVVRVDAEKNLLLVRGSIPGHPGSTVVVSRARRESLGAAGNRGA
ncbi:MAG TPA: 50S ribosomal protein L3 [Candidatus Polarisedimenticolaceae bacterium]|nr:50S ribosomal protein L3 [Candidatus Polarisedimenticolaceae bacterium]